ncbi:DNA-binding transcriptional LysR family regulator [Brevibacterium sanguinis]|uniref:DNA-binding transcriptional LysR family regulator n=2 Tax=Brevibacterium TaxID=1696 RepID=A0A366IN81_9MICO|nr:MULTISPECIES: LysR family transcriptional regulator [Brevibacterium]RBP67100.1 DNA-binding transcriptional LysR family regulator [Brevibacterium sanguinis]RBP73625.1 DNA-binding transcriptional LysR family regulator [Brevibacterium celere]
MPTHAPGGSHPQISPEDLLTLLAVARLGKFTAAAHSLGLNHTTVSRRIAALEKAYGERVLVASPDGWELSAAGRELLPVAEDIESALARIDARGSSALAGTIRLACPQAFALEYAVPALTRLQSRHPGLQVELMTVTQRARQYRSGVDIEVVVGKPEAPRSIAKHIRDYRLQLYASQEYARTHTMPRSLEDLAEHRLIYYIEHSLHVEDLDEAAEALPRSAGFFRSTSVHAHVLATSNGVGIGILPDFLARHNSRLAPVLPEQFSKPVSYWASVRHESLRNAGVRSVLEVL